MFSPVIFYGLAILLGIIVFYVAVSVAIERAPGCLMVFLIIGVAIACFVYRP
jgi:hypothetical protein